MDNTPLLSNEHSKPWSLHGVVTSATSDDFITISKQNYVSLQDTVRERNKLINFLSQQNELLRIHIDHLNDQYNALLKENESNRTNLKKTEDTLNDILSK